MKNPKFLNSIVTLLCCILMACQEESKWEILPEDLYFEKAGSSYLKGQFYQAELQCIVGLELYPKSQRLKFLLDRLKVIQEEERKHFSIEEPPPEGEKTPQDPDEQENQENQSQNEDENSSGQSDGRQSSHGGQSSGGSEGANSSANSDESEDGQSEDGNSQDGTESSGDGGTSSNESDESTSEAEGQSSAAGSSSASNDSESSSEADSEARLGGESSEAEVSEEEMEKLKMQYIEKRAAEELLEQFQENEAKREHRKYRSRPGQKDW